MGVWGGILLCCVTVAIELSSAQNDVSLILLLPKLIYDGEKNMFILDVENQPEDGDVTLKVVDSYNGSTVYYTKNFSLPKAEGSLFKLNVSDIKIPRTKETRYMTSFLVVLDAVFGQTKVHQNASIQIQPQDWLMLVQTDKNMYKPGQKVYIRVMVLDYDLRPRNSGNVTVSVSDPQNNVVANFKDVSLTHMVVQFDFQLSEEPPLGTWYIEVKYAESNPAAKNADSDYQSTMTTSTFTVAEYTLPKFEVTITQPKFVLMDETDITVEVCANYTFGKPVIGNLEFNASLSYYRWQVNTEPSQFLKNKINGCLNVTIDTAKLNLTDPSYGYRAIYVVANVFEDTTNEQMNATITISRSNYPLTLSFLPSTSNKYFKPYMYTHGQLIVTKPDGTPGANEPISLCLIATSEFTEFHHDRTDIREMCKNYTSDARGMVNFTLPPHHPTVISYTINALALNYPPKYYPDNKAIIMMYQPSATTSYQSFYSPSERYIQFVDISDELQPCNVPVNLSAYYTFEDGDNLKFRYVVLARAQNIMATIIPVQNPQKLTAMFNESELLIEDYPEIFSDMAKPDDKNVARINFQVNPESNELPQLTVLLYYIYNGSEVIADSIQVTREVCLPNKVELDFSETVIQPGTSVDMILSASPTSQCGVGIVDSSVALANGGYYNPLLSYRNQLPYREIGPWQYPLADDYTHCSETNGQTDYVDVESVILTPGWNVIDYNIPLDTRPCRSNRYRPTLPPIRFLNSMAKGGGIMEDGMMFMTTTGGGGALPPSPEMSSISAVDVRDYFPEVWLYSLEAVDGTGKLTKNLSAPHQVTTWDADAMCLHPTDGLGVAETKKIKTFQAFFAEIDLPYSVKRGEKLSIVISTFNYLPHCMPVLITIDPLPGLEVNADTPLTKEACICPDSSPFQYELRVVVTSEAAIGDLSVTVTATNSSNLNVCKENAESVPSRDKITRPLKIVPEGFMMEISESRLLCSENGTARTEFEFEVPDNVINGSARSLFSVCGDLMGQATANLENLIVLPTGCGEQNMAKILSNLAVYDYLRSTKQLDPSTEDRILYNLKSGYQNQLRYRAQDGSYSAWGGPWAQPSSFLTAMVYGGLREARQYIFVNDEGQETTLNYILNTQNNVTGCFARIGYIYDWALAQSEAHDDTRGSYTAYVLLALYGAINDTDRIETGLLCVEAQKNMNAHALALGAYAAAVYEDDDLAEKFLTDLEAYENTKIAGQKFYAKDDVGSSENIETAAYALMAKLALSEDDATIQEVQQIARWLMKKQNRNGGFVSSQDTAIGLKAMSRFAAVTYGKQASINFYLTATGINFAETYNITKDNAIIWDTRTVKTIPNNISVSGTGSGCVVVTSQLRYNLPSIPGEAGFAFNITVTNGSTINLELCISYEGTGGQPSQMAIVEIDPLSGFRPNYPSLEALLNSQEIRRYEFQNGIIILYFDEFTPTTRCSNVKLDRGWTVEDLQPRTAKVYDYYDSGKQKSIEYGI